MSESVVLQQSVKELAREGDFRAIAYWLNLHLVPQGIYARVAADRPGYLLVLVEFMQMPQSDRLNRYLCYQLHQLHSSIIKGVRVIARFLGSSEVEWDRTIRLSASRPKRRSAARHIAPPERQLASTTVNPTRLLPQQVAQLLLASGGASFNRPQAMVLGGSAAAAFLLGCGMEVMNYYAPQPPVQAEGAPRPDRVQTALGQVRVIEATNANPGSTAPNSGETEVRLSFSNTPAILEAIAPAQLSPATSGSPTATPDSSPQPRPQRQVDVALTAPQPNLTALTVTASKPRQVLPELPQLTRSRSAQTTEKTSTEMAEALDALERQGFVPVGAGRNAGEARRPEIVDVRGKRIAYLGYSDSNLNSAGFWQAGTNPALSDRITEDIQAIRNQVDWVIVSYHWNQALASYPSIAQMTLARHAIDSGADLVVGYHPQVLQGAEIYRGRAIVYSLGDFVFSPQSETTATNHDTAMLKVSLKGDQMRLEFLPVQVVESKPRLASGEKASQILDYLDKASALFKQPLRSPTILEKQPSGQVPNQPTLERSPTSSATSETPAPPSASDSFITQPKTPAIAPAIQAPVDAVPEEPTVTPSAQPAEVPKTPSGGLEAPSKLLEEIPAPPAAQPTPGAMEEGMKEILPIDAVSPTPAAPTESSPEASISEPSTWETLPAENIDESTEFR